MEFYHWKANSEDVGAHFSVIAKNNEVITE